MTWMTENLYKHTYRSFCVISLWTLITLSLCELCNSYTDRIYSKSHEIHYNSKQTLKYNKTSRNLLTVLSSVKLIIPAGNLLTCRAEQERCRRNTPPPYSCAAIVDSFCCSSFRNTNNVTGTSKACGSLKWKCISEPDPLCFIQENDQEFVTYKIHLHSLNKLNSFSSQALKAFSRSGFKFDVVSSKQTIVWETGRWAQIKLMLVVDY